MMIAGIGCRRGGMPEWVQAAIDAALAQTGRTRTEIAALATSPARAQEPAILAVAQALGVMVKGDSMVMNVKSGHATVASGTQGRNTPNRVRGVFYSEPTKPAAAGAAAPAAGANPTAKPAK